MTEMGVDSQCLPVTFDIRIIYYLQEEDILMKIVRLLLKAALIAACLTAVSAAGTELHDIPLEWKPTETVSAMDAVDLTVFHNITFVVSPFNDIRKKPEEIGKNVEKRLSDRPLLVTTKDNVASWMTGRFAKILEEFEIDVVKSGGTFVIEGDIVKFYVTEESTYKADVALKVRVKTPGGAVLWEGLIAASATRFGSSYKAENYYEALSNATVSAVHALLKNDSFKQAIQKNTPARAK